MVFYSFIILSSYFLPDNPTSPYDYTYFISALFQVGKTSILKRFINDSFDEYYQATIGIDIMSKDITLRDRTVSAFVFI